MIWWIILGTYVLGYVATWRTTVWFLIMDVCGSPSRVDGDDLAFEAELELCRLWRKHPLAGWARDVRGVGEKTIARLISEIGDPADRSTVSQLWSYCGLNPERKRRKGMGQEDALACGNPNARKRLWLIATSMLKAGNRELYDARRLHTAETHPEWTPGHSHNDALRIVAKAFVRDLWIASRQSKPDTQCSRA